MFLPLHAALYVTMTFKLVWLVHKVLTSTKERRNAWQLVGGQDDNKKDNTRVNEGGEMSPRWKGCQDGWHVLDQLCSVIGKIPCNVPEAKSSDKLAGYNQSTALSACSGILQDKIWENIMLK